MSLLPDNPKIIGQGITGSEGSKAAEWMIEYGTNLIGGVTPGREGRKFLGNLFLTQLKKLWNL